jgi:hypothetical protein
MGSGTTDFARHRAGRERKETHMIDPNGPTIEDIEGFVDRMEGLVARWRNLEEPLSEIRREMQLEAST